MGDEEKDPRRPRCPMPMTPQLCNLSRNVTAKGVVWIQCMSCGKTSGLPEIKPNEEDGDAPRANLQ